MKNFRKFNTINYKFSLWKNNNNENLERKNKINKYKNKYSIKIINFINSFSFFMINLLNVTNNEILKILLFIFINNIYILIYENLIEYNYKIFKKIYKKYEK
jgi:hypothetical protein